MRKTVVAAAMMLAVGTMTPTPSTADEQDDVALAGLYLKAIEISVESAKAARVRADAALVAIMSKNPETGVAGSGITINRCLQEFKTDFQERCAAGRRYDQMPELQKTDDELTAMGCLTRAEATASNCFGNLALCPERPNAPADSILATCLKDDDLAVSLHESLYDAFFYDEVDKWLEGVAPTERDAVREQIQPTDV